MADWPGIAREGVWHGTGPHLQAAGLCQSEPHGVGDNRRESAEIGASASEGLSRETIGLRQGVPVYGMQGDVEGVREGEKSEDQDFVKNFTSDSISTLSGKL